jgi:hypothetical protein
MYSVCRPIPPNARLRTSAGTRMVPRWGPRGSITCTPDAVATCRRPAESSAMRPHDFDIERPFAPFQQSYEGALIPCAPIRLHVKGKHVLAFRVGDVQRPLVKTQGDPIGPGDPVIQQYDFPVRAHVVDVAALLRHEVGPKTRRGVREIDTAVSVENQVVW